MQNGRNYLNRRAFVKLAGIVAVGSTLVDPCEGDEKSRVGGPLFDGKSLDGWLQIENDATLLSSGGIANQAAFVNKLAKGADAYLYFCAASLRIR